MRQQSVQSLIAVSDRPAVIRGLRHVFPKTGRIRLAAVVRSLGVGLEHLNRHRPTLVLIDAALGGGEVIAMVGACARMDWECPALVVALTDDPQPDMALLRAGIAGYVRMPQNMARLAEDVATVMKGGSPLDPFAARMLLTEVANDAPPALTLNLTKREIEVLRTLSQGLRRDDIAVVLGITPGTVGNHIASIYRKLDVSSNVQAVAMATSLGIL